MIFLQLMLLVKLLDLIVQSIVSLTKLFIHDSFSPLVRIKSVAIFFAENSGRVFAYVGKFVSLINNVVSFEQLLFFVLFSSTNLCS